MGTILLWIFFHLILSVLWDRDNLGFFTFVL